MSWWLFIPFAWIAVGSNLILAPHFSWNGATPDFLLLLLSFVAVRPTVARRLPQSLGLGILMDLSGTRTLGIHAAAAVLTVAVLARWTTDEPEEPPAWPLWAFPTISLCLLFIEAGRGLSHSFPTSLFPTTVSILATAAVTMGCGIVLLSLLWLAQRLLFGQARGRWRDAHSGTFFLAR
jgi:rod shape-determining protein MreD